MKFKKNIKKLRGDASYRIFYRNINKDKSSIFVFSKKDKKSNLLNYDAINQVLIKNNILAPKLLSENYDRSYIEIQDFGNQTVFNFLNKHKVNQLSIFKRVLKLLKNIQKIRTREIKNFKKNNYKIPFYKPKILFDETKLFSDWYVKKKISKSKYHSFKKKFSKQIKDLIKKLNLKNDTFVHRDFHVSNLMIVKNKIGIIDSQDALIGNKAYDLASLIDDVRFKTSPSFKKKIYELYFKSQTKSEEKHFKSDFEIISVLRNLKIIGIFTRLALRDKKKQYLSLIPYAWKLIELRSRNIDKFKDLNNLLNTYKKILNR